MRASLPQDVQLHRFAGQLLQLGAEPVGLRTGMAHHGARPGGINIDPDVVQVPADRHRQCPGRLSYPPAYQITDLLDALNATGGWPGSRAAMTIRRAVVYFSPVSAIRARTCFLNALSSVTPCPLRRCCPVP